MARRQPLLYVIDEAGVIVNASVPKNQVEIEDTWLGLGHAQGRAQWLPSS
jgi:hypothetical protein